MRTAADSVRHWAQVAPRHLALAGADRRLGYAELDERVERAAGALAAHGVPGDELIATAAGEGTDAVILALALIRAGQPFLPLNTRLAPVELGAILGHAGAPVVIADAANEGLIGETVASVEPRPRLIPIAELAGGGASRAAPARAVDPHGVERVIYTSGTTGSPKGVCFTAAQGWWHAHAFADRFGMGPNDRALVALPLYHVSGLDTPGLGIFHVGGTLVCPDSYRGEDVAAAMTAQEVTIALIGPQTGRALVDLHAAGRAGPWPAMRWVLQGMSDEDELARIFPNAFVARAYGLTEASGIAVCEDPRQAKLPGAFGSPLPGLELRLDAPARGEPGEVWLRGPLVTGGYWRNPEATRSRLVDGWLRTGDRMRHDPDGGLRFVDRLSDVIKSGGENITAGEVEAVLEAHPAVVESAVFAVPDARWDEVPAAVVVIAAGHPADPSTIDALHAHCATRLAKFKRPVTIDAVGALARNVSGKIDKRALAERWIAEHAERAGGAPGEQRSR